MQVALDEALLALEHDDVPVGAVVLVDGRVIAQRHNEREKTKDPTAHAEILALRDASEVLNTWHLENATLVVTLEPCTMCAGAAVNARLGTLVFGASDPKAGAVGSLYDICNESRLNHQVEVVSGILAEASSHELKSFFAARRKPGSASTTPISETASPD